MSQSGLLKDCLHSPASFKAVGEIDFLQKWKGLIWTPSMLGNMSAKPASPSWYSWGWLVQEPVGVTAQRVTRNHRVIFLHASCVTEGKKLDTLTFLVPLFVTDWDTTTQTELNWDYKGKPIFKNKLWRQHMLTIHNLNQKGELQPHKRTSNF